MSSKYIFKILPYLVIAGMCVILYLMRDDFFEFNDEKEVVTNHTIVEKIEALGKLELVKYNFKEITEFEKISKELDFKLFKLKAGGDTKIMLITKGEAVGCLDLTKIKFSDIKMTADSIAIQLPAPELCYYKLDLKETKLYSVETGYFTNTEEEIEKAYRYAESGIKQAALESGILKQTKENAVTMLQPLLEEITRKKVYLSFPQENIKVNSFR